MEPLGCGGIPISHSDNMTINVETSVPGRNRLSTPSGSNVKNGFGTTPGTKPTTISECKVNNFLIILQIKTEEKSKGKTLPPSKTPGQPNEEAGAVTSNLSNVGGRQEGL